MEDADEFMCEACPRWFCSVAAVKLSGCEPTGSMSGPRMLGSAVRAARAYTAAPISSRPRLAAGSIAEADEADRLLRSRLGRVGMRVSAGMPCRRRLVDG